MSGLEQAVWRRMIEFGDEKFSFADFVPNFSIANNEYQIANGTFRNITSRLLHAGMIRVAYYSPQAFYYVIKQCSTMTGIHTSVNSPLLDNNHNYINYRHLCNDPVYRIIQNIPMGKRSVHDIRLKFAVPGIWFVLSSKFKPNERSKDIPLVPWPWKINNLDLKVTVHHTDTVGIDIGCSFCPVAVDIHGVIRLSSGLAIARERLSNIIESSNNHQNSNLYVLDLPCSSILMDLSNSIQYEVLFEPKD